MKQPIYSHKEKLTGTLIVSLVLLLCSGLFIGESALLFAISFIASISFGTYFLVELYLPDTAAWPYRKLIMNAVPTISYIILFFTSGVASSYLNDSQHEQTQAIYQLGDYYTLMEDYASSLDSYGAFASLVCVAAFAILLADLGMFFSIREKLKGSKDKEEAPKAIEESTETKAEEPQEASTEEPVKEEASDEESPDEETTEEPASEE